MSTDDKPRSNVNVDDEVKRLFRANKGKLTSSEIKSLRSKYGDAEVADKIEQAYWEKFSHINKKAKKFAQLIREKYSNQQYPFHVLLEKARAFKTKYDLDEDEFAAFQRIYEQELVGISSPEVYTANTNMMKVLGSVTVDFNGFTSKLSDSDFKALQEILKLHASSKPLHAQVLLQSMQYEDCGYEALTGEYRRELGHKAHEHVHPVIAALFLPKIATLESHFLQSNIANIVKSRYNNEPLSNRPDYELFYHLTRDPNDVVCDSRSAVLDLLNRANLQNQLWNCVLNLRNGQYYNASFRDFIGAIDMCKLNKHDTPDFIYGRFDGTVLRRILSAFSFTPTIVSTLPTYNIVNTNPYQQNVKPVVTSVSMVNLRLPPTVDNVPLDLSDALNQQQFIIENGVMIPRNTSIIYSRGVLFFYVDRRSTIYRTAPTLQPFNISQMPVSLAGFERINTRPVDSHDQITIRNDVYRLRSVVVAELSSVKPNYIVGSSALVIIPANITSGQNISQVVKYDPLSVLDPDVQDGHNVRRINPINGIRYSSSNNDVINFQDEASSRGIAFMYELVSDTTSGEVLY